MTARNPYRVTSKRGIIFGLLSDGMTPAQVFERLAPSINSGRWVFGSNVGGRRIPDPIWKQENRLRATIDQVAVVAANYGDAPNPQTPDAPKDSPDDSPEYRAPTPDDMPTLPKDHEPEKIIPKAPAPATYLARVRRARKYCDEKAATGQRLDSISMRPAVYGKAALKEGISADALLYAMTMHWPPESRVACGIPATFDQATESGEIDVDFDAHDLLGYALKLAKARVPILFVGPAGTGKSTLAKQVARVLGLPYGETPLTAGATPSWLLGRHTLKDYVSAPFVDIYANGGVFCFEELDAADPNMLLVVNNALANGAMHNPVTGQEIKRHPDFIATATANTFGLGATRDFTARERLDGATIDRWRMGRVQVPLDETLETALFEGAK